ncbi:hypothetical protein P4O66_019890 [Electrophorus voltai]|uniref:Sleeping Beauty transposase HTH domain-containing protein n=1 Tax=Electrophorus voltai TaxID=2609070 RepID=A0AAD9E8A6_9TELE|nr:hypothetical protein P4O66_019890 [Electrophorus voltai]
MAGELVDVMEEKVHVMEKLVGVIEEQVDVMEDLLHVMEEQVDVIEELVDVMGLRHWFLITKVPHKKHLMMGKTSKLSQDLPNLIVAKHTDGIGYRRISRLLKVQVSTVGAIIRKWKEHNFIISTGHNQVLPTRFQLEE